MAFFVRRYLLLEILEYFSLSPARQRYWVEEIRQGDWRAAPYLAGQLQEGTFQGRYGPGGRVFLLTEGGNLLSFCTLVRRDEIPVPGLTPWIGFVYTFPAFRGHRYSETLIDHVCKVAAQDGYTAVYISSDEVGLYEKYGFTFLGYMSNDEGHETQVFSRRVS